MKLTLLFLLAAASMASVDAKERSNQPRKVVCYYESWAQYLVGDARVLPENLNPTACTHLIFAFASLKNSVIGFAGAKASADKQLLGRLVDLRKHNAHLTVMVALGGYTEGSTKFSKMVRSPVKRRIFVASVVKFLKESGADGIDLDWEFPTYFADGGNERSLGRSNDRADFVTLLAELKHAFAPYGFVLSSTVAGAKDIIDRAYDVVAMNRYLDFINVMAFDYRAADQQTAYTSPLYAPSNSSADQVNNAAFSVEYLIRKGAAPEKLVLGIPLYGKAYKLAGSDNRLGAKAISVNDAPTFRQLCKTLSQPGWETHFDEKAKAAFARNGNQWISYDCPKVIAAKLDYVVEKKLGGAFVWAVDNEDVKGTCGFGKAPMMKMMMKVLNKVDVSDVQLPQYSP